MDGCVIEVKVTPGAKKEGVGPLADGVLRVRVTEAPEKGKANYAVISLVAEFFDLPKREVVILSGETSRRKKILLPASVKDKLLLLEQERS
ncbi:DUF167 family protein [Chlamydiifrater phoenicopteri]|uniref:DUF167 family protein n=1 Tax=Chlamydiifrater phoenicopteri TaxID=2681469 RepID=UPI001FE44DA6|nr:DUF167 family protein [Chlamydiifrater phoenicopteri]